jgi:hypothetical protein
VRFGSWRQRLLVVQFRDSEVYIEITSALVLSLEEARVEFDFLLKLHPPILEGFQWHRVAAERREEVESIANDPLCENFRRDPSACR